jgi:hypothetical protein
MEATGDLMNRRSFTPAQEKDGNLLKIFDKPVVTQAEAEVTEKGFSNKKKHGNSRR